MTLSEWMKVNNLSQAQAGEVLGVRSGTVCRWVTGQRRPNTDMAFQIEERTGGKVPASSWRRPAGSKKRGRGSKVRHARTMAQPSGRA